MENQQDQPQAVSSLQGKRRFLTIEVICATALASVAFWLLGRGKVSTDDAQVEGHLVPIAARVNGCVAGIEVDDNQRVPAGQLLVMPDQRDLDAALRRAEADLANVRAQALAATSQVGIE